MKGLTGSLLPRLVVASVLLAGCGGPPPRAAAPPNEPPPWTSETTSAQRIHAGWYGGRGVAQSMTLMTIPASRTTTATDIAVQVTMLYTADEAPVGVFLQVPDETARVHMRPRNYRLDSRPQRTATTTVRWINKNVPPSSEGYDVILGIGGEGVITRTETHVTVSRR